MNRSTRIPILVFVLVLVHGCKTPSVLVTEEQRLGDYHNNRNEFEQAITHYSNALDASKKLGVYRNLDSEADMCRKISQCYSVLGQYGPSGDYLVRAIQVDSARGNTLELIEDRRELGKVFLYRGDFPSGLEQLHLALQLNNGMEESLKGKNRLSIADTYLTLSRVQSVLGDFRQGELYGLNALEIYRALQSENGEMEALLQLGKIAIRRGSGPSGRNYVEQSLNLAQKLELNTYRHKLELAHYYENQALYEDALRMKLEATDEVKKIHNLPQTIWAHMLTGDLFMVLGDERNARKYYQTAISYIDSSRIQASSLEASVNLRAGDLDQAYAYFSGAGAEVAAGIAAMRLGEAAMEWNLWEEALQHLDNALEHLARSDLSDGEARVYINRILCQMHMERFREATANLQKARSLVRYDETRWRLLFTQGMLFESMGEPDSAIAAYTGSVEVIERIRGNLNVEEYKSLYLENKMEVYQRLIRLLMEQGRSLESFRYSERARARAFLDMLGNGRILIRQDEHSELVEKEQNLRNEIISLNQLVQRNDMGITRGISRSRIEERIRNSREAYEGVLTQLKLFNPAYSAMVSLETQDLSRLLKGVNQKTAFLVYWIGPEELYIWMITPEGIQSRKVPVAEEEMIRWVSRGRDAVGSRNHKEVYAPLYDLLITPFEKELEPYETIGIVPHLPLHFLPFQCLMPDSGSYLIDRFNLFYVPSMNVYALAKEKPVSGSGGFFGMALGNMELAGLPGLPGTARELSYISTLFQDPRITFGPASTESLFKSGVGPYGLVHLATHGILDQHQPMYSYLLLAPSEDEDGLLTVNEVFGLEMNARLVVLSACETALGTLNNGDEIVGMARAFLFAGAKDVVVSLWSVADEPTAFLMNFFYRSLRENNAVESLRLAQIATRERYPAPVYWAPFQMIGSD